MRRFHTSKALCDTDRENVAALGRFIVFTNNPLLAKRVDASATSELKIAGAVRNILVRTILRAQERTEQYTGSNTIYIETDVCSLLAEAHAVLLYFRTLCPAKGDRDPVWLAQPDDVLMYKRDQLPEPIYSFPDTDSAYEYIVENLDYNESESLLLALLEAHDPAIVNGVYERLMHHSVLKTLRQYIVLRNKGHIYCRLWGTVYDTAILQLHLKKRTPFTKMIGELLQRYIKHNIKVTL